MVCLLVILFSFCCCSYKSYRSFSNFELFFTVDLFKSLSSFIGFRQHSIFPIYVNEKNLSIIDLGDCAKKLIEANNLPDNTDLIILKLENMNMKSNEIMRVKTKDSFFLVCNKPPLPFQHRFASVSPPSANGGKTEVRRS